MHFQLRDYQEDAVAEALRAFLKGRPFIIQAATAAGKSLIISELCHRLDKPVLILQPNKEILEQNYAKLQSYGITDIGLYSASVGKKDIAKFTFATIGSIHRKPKEFAHFEYAILDECHQLSPKKVDGMYMKFFREAGISKVCGLTATPFRLENKFFQDTYTGSIKMLNRITRNSFFKDIAYKVEMADLIERGFLTKPYYHTFDTDMGDLIFKHGRVEYDAESMEQWSDKNLTNLSSIAAELDKRHKRVLVFCTSLRQAARAVEMLQTLGIHAEGLDAKTPTKQRESLIERFQDGRLRWVVNVGTMTTGFDCPPLDAVVLMRPTMSVGLYIQMLGRCLRLDPADPDKKAHFYDFTGTVQKFGKAETIRLAKEDGFKDMLISEVGRLDNEPLFSFQVKTEKFKKKKPETPKEITRDYLFSLV